MMFSKIVQLYGLDFSTFKMIRHGYKEIDPLDLFRTNPDKFDSYQAFMRTHKRNYDGSNFIAVFAPYGTTQAILLGVWQVLDKIPATKAPKFRLNDVKEFCWNLRTSSYYKLRSVKEFSDISERLIIEWEKSTVSWVQKKDKKVVAILPEFHVGEFVSYEETIVNWSDLVSLSRNPTHNASWITALKSVNGIYCITDLACGRCYIGSAYGKDGIWGRWRQYAKHGHGGNDQLIELVGKKPKAPEKFQFSILEILPATCTQDDAIKKEGIWKRKLGTRVGGYNSN